MGFLLGSVRSDWRWVLGIFRLPRWRF